MSESPPYSMTQRQSVGFGDGAGVGAGVGDAEGAGVGAGVGVAEGAWGRAAG